jgi:transglutaminase superfamily protein
VRRVAALRPDDWVVLAEALGTLAVVFSGLRLVKFPRVAAWATGIAAQSTGEWTRDRIERVARIVTMAGRLTGVACLSRSLALARMLGRRGVATAVRIGVRTDHHGELDAHAWVEWRGCPVNDTPRALQPFAPFTPAIGDVVNG